MKFCMVTPIHVKWPCKINVLREFLNFISKNVDYYWILNRREVHFLKESFVGGSNEFKLGT